MVWPQLADLASHLFFEKRPVNLLAGKKGLLKMFFYQTNPNRESYKSFVHIDMRDFLSLPRPVKRTQKGLNRVQPNPT